MSIAKICRLKDGKAATIKNTVTTNTVNTINEREEYDTYRPYIRRNNKSLSNDSRPTYSSH